MLLSYSTSTGALESPNSLLSCSVITISLHNTIILMITHLQFQPLNLLTQVWATSCTNGYFCLDLMNMILNDFIFKVGGYQKKSARRIEYFHHILCIVATCASNYLHANSTACQFKPEWSNPSNPIIHFVIAEISTPFLIAWRMTGEKSTLLYTIFVLLFLAVRIGYQTILYIPASIQSCSPYPLKALFVLYGMLQVSFSYFVLGKFKSIIFPAPKKMGSDDKIKFDDKKSN